MKLDIRIEDGEPIIFFADNITRDKNIMRYSIRDEHSSDTRGYMRGLKKPVTIAEICTAGAFLGRYFSNSKE